MKNILRILPAILLGILLMVNTSRAEQVHYKSGSPGAVKQTAAGCAKGANFKWLEINNVRTRINTGGDMWWDFEVAQYEIPKGSKKMSMFAAALWIGGVDANGQLKLAAQRFRQGPNSGTAGSAADFFPGPLTIDGTASVSPEVCAEYDRLHYITRAEVDDFLAWFEDKESNPDYQIPASIMDYPAHGDEGIHQSYYMAPFYDNNLNGEDPDGDYDPVNDGDYPYYDLSNELCGTKTPTAEDIYYNKENTGNLVDQVLKGDATLWWVFNDKGNIHTETGGEPIGLEIRAQAFGFSTNDEINNMTFYSYEIINRSTYRLTETYFSQWVDTDLGFAEDDYVGCDVMRGLGYCYNGTAIDGNGQSWAYGNQPPAVGVDFFQGPYIDADKNSVLYGDNPSLKGDDTWFLKGDTNQRFTGGAQLVQWDGDTIQKNLTSGTSIYAIVNSAAINGINFGNGIEDDERFGMRRFVYHNNGGPFYMQDPSKAIDYYNLLRGIWKDGTKMLYGGNGHITAGANVPPQECDFMFPGTSDIYDWGTKGNPIVGGPKNWTEVSAGNPPDDRRFMESAGPFILEPGAVNYITVGIPWARAMSGGPQESVKLLQQVDDKCQQLFDNCFKVISGPNAPDLTIREMDKELILYISNRKTNDAGNNYQERYTEYDPRIQGAAGDNWDSLYHFEGYQIYQLKTATVSVADLKNTEQARLVFQCDVKNNVSRLINFYYDQNLGGSVPVEEVVGANKGIIHSVKMTEDAFTGDNLVNHKQYYYMALSYGQNNYKPYNQTEPTGLNGQKLPYLAGRKNIKTYTGIPHLPVGLVSATSNFDDGLVVTRIAGQGNGGNYLDLSDESIAEILSKPMADSVSNLPGSDTYPISYNPVYKKDAGPISVKVIDPLNVKDASYTLKFDSMYNMRVPVGEMDTNLLVSFWSLTDDETGKVYVSDTSINVKNEQLFLDLGLSVTIEQPLLPGPYMVSRNNEGTSEWAVQLFNNGVLGASISYQDSLRPWLNFHPDVDGIPEYDWIRSGVAEGDWQNTNKKFDPDGNYESILGGTWTPYMFAASGDSIFSIAHKEGAMPDISKQKNLFVDIPGVDIVFTSDPSKWTRSVVIEESPKFADSEGNAKKHEIRKGRSVNQNGDTAVVSSDPALNSDFISPYGMGWFPGYAINVETGERLNIMYGEDSRLIEDNGRDMKFNPSSRDIYFDESGEHIVLGGRHYIYIMAHTANKKSYADINTPDTKYFPTDLYDNPAYDGGAHFVTYMNWPYYKIPQHRNFGKGLQFSNCVWTAIPLGPAGQYGWLDNEATIKLRISKPYARYFATEYNGPKNENNYWPMYTFKTEGVATNYNDVVKAETDLDLINIVPNPYYAYSKYETNQLDNRVKITNLPQRCKITIYSTNGNLIRQYDKDESKTSIDWDLKNFAGIPIAGGVYIIHIKSDQGEKILKWFGSLRPVDLNAF